MKWIENRKNTVKNRWDFVGIFTCDCKCVSVCGCLCGLLLRIIVCICGWHIVYVYAKVQMQCVFLTRYKDVDVSYFCYIILFLYE